MFRAFGLPWDPKSFTEGKFIEANSPRYASLLAKLTKEMPKMAREWCDGHELPDFFEILFRYRTRVEAVLSFSSGVLQASGLFLHAHRQAGELNGVIRDNIAIVDDALLVLISPEGASFSGEQLARDYGYPDIDLDAIDSAWW